MLPVQSVRECCSTCLRKVRSRGLLLAAGLLTLAGLIAVCVLGLVQIQPLGWLLLLPGGLWLLLVGLRTPRDGSGTAERLDELTRQLEASRAQLEANRIQLEQRIEDRTRELQQSQALIVQGEKQAAFGLLAAGIAHEVGNPLAAISSLVQMLNRRPHDDYTRERLQMVDDQLRRIQRTLRELVDFSRPATREKVTCDVHEAIDAALNIAKYYKRTKGKQLLTHYASGLPLIATARDQLVQVVLNLVLNAMDATEEGQTIELRTTLLPDRPTIRIEVRDNGHGILEQHQPLVFQPYFTTKETGTGLGLFVCRYMVEQTLGGQLQLISSSPQGTVFAVDLPITAQREGASDAPSDPQAE